MMEERTIQKRQTAYKVWISMLHNGKYVKQLGEWEPNYLEVEGMKIGRVNLIASIVGKFTAEDNGYVAYTIDDGTASIRIKAWREDAMAIQNYKVGDLILVIGKPKEYNEEIYISPEIVKVLDDPNLELLRKLELHQKFGKVKPIEKYNVAATTLAQPQPTASFTTANNFEEEKIGEEVIAESIEEDVERAPMVKEEEIAVPGENKRQVILDIIEKLAGEDGAPMDSIIESSGMNEEEVEMITQELLKEGEIYQNRPGRLSILG